MKYSFSGVGQKCDPNYFDGHFFFFSHFCGEGERISYLVDRVLEVVPSIYEEKEKFGSLLLFCFC